MRFQLDENRWTLESSKSSNYVISDTHKIVDFIEYDDDYKNIEDSHYIVVVDSLLILDELKECVIDWLEGFLGPNVDPEDEDHMEILNLIKKVKKCKDLKKLEKITKSNERFRFRGNFVNCTIGWNIEDCRQRNKAQSIIFSEHDGVIGRSCGGSAIPLLSGCRCGAV